MTTIIRAAVRRLPAVETVVDLFDWCAGIAVLAYLSTALCLGRLPWIM